MLSDPEIKLLDYCVHKTITEIHICNFAAYGVEPHIYTDEKYISLNCWMRFVFDNGISFVTSRWQDEWTEEYRCKIRDYRQFNPESLTSIHISETSPWDGYIGQEMSWYTILSHPTRYDKWWEIGMEDTVRGIEYSIGNRKILCAALHSDDPFHKGTNNEILVSDDRDFIQTQKTRFEDFVGFYGEL